MIFARYPLCLQKHPEFGAPAGGIPLPVAHGFALPQLAVWVKGAKRRSEPLMQARNVAFCFGDGLTVQVPVIAKVIAQASSLLCPLTMQESHTYYICVDSKLLASKRKFIHKLNDYDEIYEAFQSAHFPNA